MGLICSDSLPLSSGKSIITGTDSSLEWLTCLLSDVDKSGFGSFASFDTTDEPDDEGDAFCSLLKPESFDNDKHDANDMKLACALLGVVLLLLLIESPLLVDVLGVAGILPPSETLSGVLTAD